VLTARLLPAPVLARWLRDRDLQRETESGLNVVENYNGVNDYIRFGKRGELASNRREEQELGMLCLHILQSSLGLINTLMIQDTLALPEWADVLTDADRRGLTPRTVDLEAANAARRLRQAHGHVGLLLTLLGRLGAAPMLSALAAPGLLMQLGACCF